MNNSIHIFTLPAHGHINPTLPMIGELVRRGEQVTHGGMNSVSESLWHGVPMVVVPQGGDQLFIAHRVEQVGAGVRLEAKKVSVASLRRCADRVLANPNYAVASRRMGDELRDCGGYQRAADEVQAFLQTRISPAKVNL